MTIPANTPLGRIPDAYSPSGCHSWLMLEHGKDRGKQLYYSDQVIGHGGKLQTLLFVHGNPECSCIFNKTISALNEKELPRTRIITFDHIGFGLSSQASRLMAPQDHAENLVQLLTHLSPENLTLVVHDWGGPIGLGALLQKPELLQSLVILNSSIFPLSGSCNYRTYPFRHLSWERMSHLVPDRHWGLFAAGAISSRAKSCRELLTGLLQAPFRHSITTYKDNPYVMQFASPNNVASSRYLARLSADWCDPERTQDSELRRFYLGLQSEVANYWGQSGAKIRVRLLCGEWDPLGNRENMQRWLEALPQLAGWMQFVPCGHFVPENYPEEIARIIYSLLTTSGVDG